MFRIARLFSTGSSIKQRIQKDLIASMKAKDTGRSSILRQLQTELTNCEKAKAVPSEKDLIAALRGCSERWEKAISDYTDMIKSNPTREEDIKNMVAKEQAELDVIKQYLPAGYSCEELECIIGECIEALNEPPKMGPVMKAVLERVDLSRITRKDLAAAVTKLVTVKKQ